MTGLEILAAFGTLQVMRAIRLNGAEEQRKKCEQTLLRNLRDTQKQEEAERKKAEREAERRDWFRNHEPSWLDKYSAWSRKHLGDGVDEKYWD